MTTEPDWLKSKLEESGQEPEWGSKNSPNYFSSGENHLNNNNFTPTSLSKSRKSSLLSKDLFVTAHESSPVLEDLLENADEDDPFAFFRPLLRSSEEERKNITKQLIDLLTRSKTDFLQSQLIQIVILAYYSPFEDITTSFRDFLLNCKQIGLSVPLKRTTQSRFIPPQMYSPLPLHKDSDPLLLELYSDLFLSYGRVSNLFQTIGLHPTFLDKFLSCYHFIMSESSSPLPLSWRNYLAIISANRFKCKILVDQQENEFLMNGGDPSWLNGIVFISPKLKKILDIIELICHQPWLIRPKHIKEVVRGTDSWLISELLHALIIVCTFKQLCGLMFGLGIMPEPDYDDEVDEELFDLEMSTDDLKNIEFLKLLRGSEALGPTTISNNNNNNNNNNNPLDSSWEKKDPFISAETDHQELDESKFLQITDYPRYTGNFTMRHKDFDVRSKEYKIFRIQDYCWADEGFELMRQYLPNGGSLLNDTAQHIYALTYRTFARESNVNTEPIRRAIWQYIQRVKGMRHDDYDYGEVNTFCTANLKSFIKKITCFPEAIIYTDFSVMEMELTPVEKVHVALLATESSKQAELVYGLYALEQFQSGLSEND